MQKTLQKTYLLLSLIVFSCAGHGSGILVQFDSSKPFDQSQLERHCDMEDSAACLLMGKAVPLNRVPIIQGVAPEGRAVFAVLLPKGQKTSWYFREAGTLKLNPLQVYQTHSRPHSPMQVEHIQAKDLKAGQAYELIGVNSLGQLLDRRHFHIRSTKDKFRFALISSTDDHSSQPGLWADLAQQKPQLIFGLGNNVYVNSRGSALLAVAASPSQVWDRHVETRSRLPLFQQEFLIPVLVTWNDRDFGMIHGDSSYEFTDESRLTMEAFFPYIADARSVIEGPGLSRGLKVAGQTFLLLDNRSFRSVPRTEEPSYLGRIQEDWAVSHARSSDGPVWLMSGEKWFGKRTDSFESARPGSFVRFLAKLAQVLKKKKGAAAKTLFAGGAQSQTEIRRVSSFSTYELNTGFQTPVGRASSARGIPASANGGYLMVELKGAEIKAEIRGPEGPLAEIELNSGKKRR